MAGKVSLSSGKKPAQKHKNATAWVVNKHSFAAQKIASLPTYNLCQKCVEILDWRKRMGKYKPLSQPKKCVDCQQKTVTGAYHAICNACASARQVCAKCLENKEILPSTEQPKEDAIREKMELDRILEKMNERQRRSYLRKRERGDDEGADKIKNSAESKADDDDFEFSDSEEEEEFNEDGEEDEDNE